MVISPVLQHIRSLAPGHQDGVSEDENDDSHDHYGDDAGDKYDDTSSVVTTCSSKGHLALCKRLLVH